MKTTAPHYNQFLIEAFASKKAKNPDYSLRAFARFLGVSPATLSQVLSNKRDLSKQSARKVADKLGLSPVQTHQMLSQIEGATLDLNENQLIQEDVFKMMSDWYYFAILNLCKLPETNSDPEWVADRLSISVPEAEMALTRLERLGYVTFEDGKLNRTTTLLRTSDGVPSSALRNYHKQNLKLAAESIDRDAVEKRDLSSVTLPVSVADLPEAKAFIRKFQNEFASKFTSSDPNEVYTIAVQLFPVTTNGEKI